MKSKANLKSHPLHPMLIPFPLAFFTGTFLFDLLGWIQNEADFWRTGQYLEIAGIGFALLAAIPGLIDFLFTVPPQSSGKKRAAKHGIINTTNVIIFSFALYYRQGINASPYLILALELIGMVLLVVAGWMGGTLVYRNQIGVDIRYAGAGKWKEEHLQAGNTSQPVASTEELKINQMKLVHAGGRRLVIARTEKGYVAFEDHCSHRGGSLAGGSLICGTVQCPWHGSQFDTETGAVKAGPAKEKINTFALREENGKLYLV